MYMPYCFIVLGYLDVVEGLCTWIGGGGMCRILVVDKGYIEGGGELGRPNHGFLVVARVLSVLHFKSFCDLVLG